MRQAWVRRTPGEVVETSSGYNHRVEFVAVVELDQNLGQAARQFVVFGFGHDAVDGSLHAGQGVSFYLSSAKKFYKHG